MTDDDFDSFIAPADQSYRTCPECGVDCAPEPLATDKGIRLAFTCPTHGVHTVVDPFEDER